MLKGHLHQIKTEAIDWGRFSFSLVETIEL